MEEQFNQSKEVYGLAFELSHYNGANTDLLYPEDALDEGVDDLLAGEDELRRRLRVLLRRVLLVLARPEQLHIRIRIDLAMGQNKFQNRGWNGSKSAEQPQ